MSSLVRIFLVSCLGWGVLSAVETKIAYVDMDRVLNEYKDLTTARDELQKLIVSWERERDSIKTLIDSLKMVYEEEKPMLSDEGRLRREREIDALKEDYKAYWRSVWGEGGKIERKTKELVSPYVEKIKETILKISKDFEYALVLDMSSDAVLYAETEDDITQMVIDELNKEYVVEAPVGGFQPDVMVFPLIEKDEESKLRGLGWKLQGYINTGISSSPRVKTISSGQILSEMDRRGIQLEFLTIEDCQVIARALGAELYTFGSVEKKGEEVEFKVGLYNLEDNQLISEENITSDDTETELQVKAGELAKRLISAYQP